MANTARYDLRESVGKTHPVHVVHPAHYISISHIRGLYPWKTIRPISWHRSGSAQQKHLTNRRFCSNIGKLLITNDSMTRRSWVQVSTQRRTGRLGTFASVANQTFRTNSTATLGWCTLETRQGSWILPQLVRVFDQSDSDGAPPHGDDSEWYCEPYKSSVILYTLRLVRCVGSRPVLKNIRTQLQLRRRGDLECQKWQLRVYPREDHSLETIVQSTWGKLSIAKVLSSTSAVSWSSSLCNSAWSAR